MIVAIIAIALAVLWQVVGPRVTPDATYIHFGNHTFKAKVASTQPARTKGLSGTSSLPKGEAMLFVFESDGNWSIWMKDMNYPIDIVWLDQRKMVVDYVSNAAPESYPNTSFTPKEKARYVVELPSGTVQDLSIKIGQGVHFAL